MKTATMVIISLLVVSCGQEQEVITKDCSVFDNNDNTYTMVCSDGSRVTWRDGEDGIDGEDGVNGLDGKDGKDGVDGADGQNGKSCSVKYNYQFINGNYIYDGTYTLECEDGTIVVWRDGDESLNCSISDNHDGTYTMTCKDGTSLVL